MTGATPKGKRALLACPSGQDADLPRLGNTAVLRPTKRFMGHSQCPRLPLRYGMLKGSWLFLVIKKKKLAASIRLLKAWTEPSPIPATTTAGCDDDGP